MSPHSDSHDINQRDILPSKDSPSQHLPSTDTLPISDTASMDLFTPSNDTLPLERSLIDQGLVNVQSLSPTIKVSLQYATENNFIGEDVYGGLNTCYLQPEVAQMLSDAQAHLTSNHPRLVLMIYDGVRPQSVQYKMWEIVKGTPNEKYVAEPGSGSMHNYGAAVDVTLFHLDTGDVDMGTPYDFFGPLAQPRYEIQFLEDGKLTKSQVNNRRILRTSMLATGFSGILSEWWHFNAFARDTVRKKYQLVK